MKSRCYVFALLFLVPVRALAGTTVGESKESLAPLIEQLRPAVVNIQALQADAPSAGIKASDGDGEPSRSLGSGFVVDAAGYIVTNAHVVAHATDVRVVFADRSTLRAKVVGRDFMSDLALLKVDGARRLPTVRFGDSDALRVGDAVIAIGNPFGLGSSVTAGIVSAKDRHVGEGAYDELIQTDASINPGNSGGPLFDADGRVVGVSSATVENGQGIGFAIPVNTARAIITQLKQRGRVVRGWIGVDVQDVTPELALFFGARTINGALVASVASNSPAERAGIRVGDIIVTYDGRPVEASVRLPRYVFLSPPGKKAQVALLRGGRKHHRTVTVGLYRDETLGSGPPVANEERPRRGSDNIGVEFLPAGQGQGIIVSNVDPTGLAAGTLAPGDVILDIDRIPVRSPRDVRNALRRHRSKTPLLLRVRRGEQVVFVPLAPWAG